MSVTGQVQTSIVRPAARPSARARTRLQLDRINTAEQTRASKEPARVIGQAPKSGGENFAFRQAAIHGL
jgi:hypothetical protein